MKVSEYYPSTYLKGSHLEEPSYTRTIVHIDLEEVTNPEGKVETKPVITFNEPVGSGHARKLIVNKTNMMAIAEALDSDETDVWLDQKITLVRETWGGKPVIRIQH
jgi:hypothetical protein